MKWTKTKPVLIGNMCEYYWYRNKHGCEILSVFMWNGEVHCFPPACHKMFGKTDKILVSELDGEWSSEPIQEPREEAE